ncbi:MAG: hypothetical protein HY822_06045, partial [Acidobacteria bacterium]|nr:hypothetical protein [Acidobacteriota bacterium]
LSPMNTERLEGVVARRVSAAAAALAGGRAAAIYSSAPESERRQPALAIEQVFAGIAHRMVTEHGVRRLVVAGGETSGAVVNALAIPAVEIAAILDPGVPALRSLGDPPLALALKSGNFGAGDFFAKAIHHLERA